VGRRKREEKQVHREKKIYKGHSTSVKKTCKGNDYNGRKKKTPILSANTCTHRVNPFFGFSKWKNDNKRKGIADGGLAWLISELESKFKDPASVVGTRTASRRKKATQRHLTKFE